MSDERITDQAAIRASWEDDAAPLVKRVFAALNSGRDAAVIRVVLDETDALRAKVAELEGFLDEHSGCAGLRNEVDAARADHAIAEGDAHDARRALKDAEYLLEMRARALNRTGESNDHMRAQVARVRSAVTSLRAIAKSGGDDCPDGGCATCTAGNAVSLLDIALDGLS